MFDQVWQNVSVRTRLGPPVFITRLMKTSMLGSGQRRQMRGISCSWENQPRTGHEPWDFGLSPILMENQLCVIWLVFSTDIQLEHQPRRWEKRTINRSGLSLEWRVSIVGSLQNHLDLSWSPDFEGYSGTVLFAVKTFSWLETKQPKSLQTLKQIG